MQLLLFRHGIAEDHSAKGDAGRELTAEGVKKTREAAKGLARIAPKPGVILTSSRKRAVQTADIAADVLGASVEVADVLADEDLPPIVRLIKSRREEVVMLVGHEPTLGELLTYLVFGKAGSSIPLKKAGCALVDLGDGEPGDAVLCWLATPGILRELRS